MPGHWQRPDICRLLLSRPPLALPHSFRAHEHRSGFDLLPLPCQCFLRTFDLLVIGFDRDLFRHLSRRVRLPIYWRTPFDRPILLELKHLAESCLHLLHRCIDMLGAFANQESHKAILVALAQQLCSVSHLIIPVCLAPAVTRSTVYRAKFVSVSRQCRVSVNKDSDRAARELLYATCNDRLRMLGRDGNTLDVPLSKIFADLVDVVAGLGCNTGAPIFLDIGVNLLTEPLVCRRLLAIVCSDKVVSKLLLAALLALLQPPFSSPVVVGHALGAELH